MAQRRRWVRTAVVIFAVVNAVGAAFAFARGELTHGSVHLVLLLGTFAAWQVVSPRPRATEAGVPQLDTQIEQLQHSVDAIALEVERIGEGQRFINKLQQEEVAKVPIEKRQV